MNDVDNHSVYLHSRITFMLIKTCEYLVVTVKKWWLMFQSLIFSDTK